MDGGDDTSKLFIAEGAEAGSFTVSGNFERDDEAALPASTALYLYIYNEDDESDFVRGQGVIDATTGDFTATFSDLDIGYSLALLSFVVLDPADNAEESVKYTVFTLDAVNEGCSDSLRVLLEWDGNDDLGLVVTEPSGDEVSYSNEVTVGLRHTLRSVIYISLISEADACYDIGAIFCVIFFSERREATQPKLAGIWFFS